MDVFVVLTAPEGDCPDDENAYVHGVYTSRALAAAAVRAHPLPADVAESYGKATRVLSRKIPAGLNPPGTVWMVELNAQDEDMGCREFKGVHPSRAAALRAIPADHEAELRGGGHGGYDVIPLALNVWSSSDYAATRCDAGCGRHTAAEHAALAADVARDAAAPAGAAAAGGGGGGGGAGLVA